MNSLPLAVLLAIFLAAGAAVWAAGIKLSAATDVLDTRLGLGEAFGGLILLAIVTNLPEIAIVASAALAHDPGIAVGNILGGIAIQTVVLVILEAARQRGTQLPGRLADRALGGRDGAGGPDPDRDGQPAARRPAVVADRPGRPVHRHGVGDGAGAGQPGRRGLPWHEDGQPPDAQEHPRGHATKATEPEVSTGLLRRGPTRCTERVHFASDCDVRKT